MTHTHAAQQSQHLSISSIAAQMLECSVCSVSTARRGRAREAGWTGGERDARGSRVLAAEAAGPKAAAAVKEAAGARAARGAAAAAAAAAAARRSASVCWACSATASLRADGAGVCHTRVGLIAPQPTGQEERNQEVRAGRDRRRWASGHEAAFFTAETSNERAADDFEASVSIDFGLSAGQPKLRGFHPRYCRVPY